MDCDELPPVILFLKYRLRELKFIRSSGSERSALIPDIAHEFLLDQVLPRIRDYLHGLIFKVLLRLCVLCSKTVGVLRKICYDDHR